MIISSFSFVALNTSAVTAQSYGNMYDEPVQELLLQAYGEIRATDSMYDACSEIAPEFAASNLAMINSFAGFV